MKNLRWTGGSTVGKLGWIKVGKKILFERSEVVRWLHRAAALRPGTEGVRVETHTLQTSVVATVHHAPHCQAQRAEEVWL